MSWATQRFSSILLARNVGITRSSLARFSATASSSSGGGFGRMPMIGSAVAATSLAGGAYWYMKHNHSCDEGNKSTTTTTSSECPIHRIVSTVTWPFVAIKEKINGMFDEVFKDFADPSRSVLLPSAAPDAFGNVPRTLVLDVEGTLMSNNWERGVGWRPVKRPGVDLFLTRMFQAGYEIVTFSSGHQATLEPSLNRLDIHRVITHRLYRDATTYRDGIHHKDLSLLNRDLSRVIVIDDQPENFSKHTDNGIQIKKFDGDQKDSELLQLIPLLESMVADDVTDVREVLRQYDGDNVGQQFIQQRVDRAKQVQADRGGRGFTSTTKPASSWASRLGFGSR